MQPAANRHGMIHSHSNLSIATTLPGQPKHPISVFVQHSSHIMDDFLNTNDSAKAVEGLRILDCNLYHDLFVVKAILAVLEESDDLQSRVASFITVAYDAKLISRPQVTRAFEKLIQSAQSLHDGVKDVEERLFNFFATAVDDRVVDADFVSRLPEGFLKNLSQLTKENEPHYETNVNLLSEYKNLCAEFMPEFYNSGDAETVRDFFQSARSRLFPSSSDGEQPQDTSQSPSEVEGAPVIRRITKDQKLRHEFVRRLICTSLGQTNVQREMVSKVLSDLYGTEDDDLSPDDIQLGVLRTLAYVQDLSLDVPSASEMLSSFIVRMAVDDILPPAFVSDFLRLRLGDNLGVATLRRAFRWMTDSARHHLLSERFKKVWTGTDQYRPEVEEFKRELRNMIFDYFDHADVAKTVTLFNNLDMSPDQEVESVRKLIAFALERQKEEWALALGLLVTLRDEREVDIESIVKGFIQTKEKLSDISIDCPTAQEILETYFIPEAKRLDLLPDSFSLLD
eukprot:Blabericola_migrator_1__890@NODE_1219_length_5069_cov_344_036985_g827_i0_p2_GENE_NODE_1219_length_5069_cov_344_036985_g827_i0NODE_1219_length_5069_cov_344_036985_g827_i0_p2_ORF_typecomplete_len558_score106_94MA3/PF02847_17/0_013MA3/PF02847_17/2_4e07MA3/PF02847_17/2_5e06Fboxlike_2/PF13013_6/4_8e02Fboxlike_2/PF13013_6/1_4e03Fboxlike_2/PF13013_6/7_3_NODE_1219_length_5069_cov_344_036985_g827_i01451674